MHSRAGGFLEAHVHEDEGDGGETLATAMQLAGAARTICHPCPFLCPVRTEASRVPVSIPEREADRGL